MCLVCDKSKIASHICRLRPVRCLYMRVGLVATDVARFMCLRFCP